MAEIKPNPNFILWTGDSSPHWYKSPPNWTYIYEAENFVAGQIRKYFPDTPIIPILGNHDAFLPDNFPTNDYKIKGSKVSTVRLTEAVPKSGLPFLLIEYVIERV